jgi:signal transduction histidine kinase
MRINTKLRLAVLVPLMMTLAVGFALIFSWRSMEASRQNGDLVREIRSCITELNHLIFSYVIYRAERPRQQFLAEHDALTRLIDEAHPRNPEQQRLLDDIRLSTQSMKDSFLKLLPDMGHSVLTKNNRLDDVEERLVGQLLTRSHHADSNSTRLRILFDEEIRDAQRNIIAFTFLVMILTMIPLTVVLARMRKGIAASLVKLHRGTNVVGAGDLEHRLDIQANDELGEFARSFDDMTVQLHAVTVSKGILQKEVLERRKAEEALRVRTSQLEVSNKEHEAFTYTVSHDLRAPLRAIDGFSNMLQRKYWEILDAEGKRILDIIRKNSQDMGQLIDDLLAFSRLGRQQINLVEINMTNLAQSVYEELKTAAPGRNITSVIKELPMARGDKVLMRQVLVNLLSNALKFTQHCADAVIEVSGRVEENENIYYVKDNGVGFDMRYVDKLFGIFERLHNADEFEGTGVGLAIVQRVVLKHGGRAWGEAKINEGATIYFSLPR